jgi:uncharacterized protein (DUF4415 family)
MEMKERSNVTVSTWKDPDDAQEHTGEEIEHPDADWRVAGKLVSAETGKTAFAKRLRKQPVNLLLDPDIVEYFKQKAGGRGYQTLINTTLRRAMETEGLEATLRRIIREEMERGAGPMTGKARVGWNELCEFQLHWSN